MNPLARREFLCALGSGLVSSHDTWHALQSLVPGHASRLVLGPDVVQFRPEMEPVVRWIETTSRDAIIDEAVARLRQGLSYRQMLGGLFLAGIRNIKPRPVGFKFHAVMVINSAHQLALDSAQSDRLLPFFWALDNFKSSQAQDEREGDWQLAPVRDAAVPSPERARTRFIEAMDAWDEEAADAAITGLCRGAGAAEVMESLWPYGARDWHNIGHKIIFAAQSWRTLQTIGWEHAEPVLRSLVFGLLGGDRGESAAPYESNRKLVGEVRPDWQAGRPDASVTRDMLQVLRQATAQDAARQMVTELNRAVAPSTLWDAVMLAAADLLIRRPGIVALHATTACNSLHYAYQASGRSETRLLMLLQAASWIALFREGVRSRNGLPDHPRIEDLEPADAGAVPAERVLAELSQDRMAAARRMLALARSPESLHQFIDGARHVIFTKGTDSHDYKFAAAAFEELLLADTAVRPQLLAACAFQLRGGSEADSPLISRARAALASA